MTTPEQEHIKAMLSSPQWQVAENIANQMCDKISYESKVREGEWETIQIVLLDEGRIQGIRQFIKELYRIALNQDEPRRTSPTVD